MPRLTAIIHPYFGRLPVNTHECEACGSPAGQPCLLMCPLSPAYQSPEQERDEALATEAEIAAVGFMAWDSAQHRRHGLPCPYDGYDPEPGPSDFEPAPPVARKCEFLRADSRPCERDATVYGGYAGADDWAGRACDDHAQTAGFTVWDRLVPTTYVPDPGPWPDDDDLPF